MERLAQFVSELLYEIDPHRDSYDTKVVEISYRVGETLRKVGLDSGMKESFVAFVLQPQPRLIVRGYQLGSEDLDSDVRMEIPLDDVLGISLKVYSFDYEADVERIEWHRDHRGLLTRFTEEA